MNITIFTTIALIQHCFATYADDGPKDEPTRTTVEVETDKPLIERIAALKLQFEAREKALSNELDSARTVGKRGSEARAKKINEVIGNYQRDEQAIADKVIALVRSHPTGPAAFEGIILLRASVDDDLLEIVREHFMNDPRIGQFCASLAARAKDSSKRLLRDIAAKSTDRRIRGQATYSLGLYSCNLHRQMVTGRNLTDSQQDSLLAEAQGYFDRVVENYPDVTSADGTFRLADKARAELVRIVNIPKLKVGTVAPDIVGEDLDGKPLSLSVYRGKVVVLCFWATTCGPCMAMVPHERELVRRMEGKPFALVGVDCDETDEREKARKAALDEQMNWPSFWDGGNYGPIQTKYNIDHYPTLYVLDAKGIIRYIDVRDNDLDRAVDSLLLEMGTGSKCDLIK